MNRTEPDLPGGSPEVSSPGTRSASTRASSRSPPPGVRPPPRTRPAPARRRRPWSTCRTGTPGWRSSPAPAPSPWSPTGTPTSRWRTGAPRRRPRTLTGFTAFMQVSDARRNRIRIGIRVSGTGAGRLGPGHRQAVFRVEAEVHERSGLRGPADAPERQHRRGRGGGGGGGDGIGPRGQRGLWWES